MLVTGVLIGLLAVSTAVIVALLVCQSRSKKAEQALRRDKEDFHAMVDRVPTLIWAGGPDATLKYLNQACIDFCGLEKEVLLENGWLSVVHPEDLERCVGTYVPAVQSQQPYRVEYRARRVDGDYRYMVDEGLPRYGPDGTFVGYSGCTSDITEHKNAEAVICENQAALAISHREVQQLAGRLITAHEDERRHLARELHDDMTQRLALMAIDVGQMEQVSGAPGELRSLREELVKLSEDVHALSYRLHPSVLDDLGLVEALRAECERVARRGSMSVNVDVDMKGLPLSMTSDSSLCLFRIAQEAMSNALRHAHASAVAIHLTPERMGYQLVVTDNGDGFNLLTPCGHVSLGFASMRERVRARHGELDIVSAPGQGTTVTAWVPA